MHAAGRGYRDGAGHALHWPRLREGEAAELAQWGAVNARRAGEERSEAVDGVEVAESASGIGLRNVAPKIALNRRILYGKSLQLLPHKFGLALS